MPDVTMVAAECKGIAKVGGLADVVHDLSNALHAAGVPVRIVMPAYGNGLFPHEAEAKLEGPSGGQGEAGLQFDVPFGGRSYRCGVRRAKAGKVDVFGIHCPEFFGGEYSSVYVDSGKAGKGPFEDDAKRFAFFCQAAAELCGTHPAFAKTTVYHCHDWHTGSLLLLARLKDTGAFPGSARFVFTIHNLDYQGQRPLSLGESAYQGQRPATLGGPGESGGSGGLGAESLRSFESWFPGLAERIDAHGLRSVVADPSYADCYNPMRTAISLADLVNTVSPTYASEITRPDEPERNFVGGRGLQEDLSQLARSGRLSGVLNGIDYTEHAPAALDPPYDVDVPTWWKNKAAHKRRLLSDLCDRSIGRTIVPSPSSDDVFVQAPLAVCVTRLAAQKVSLLLHRLSSGPTVLRELAALPVRIVVLGTGEIQEAMAQEALACPTANFHLIPAFDAKLARMLYAAGDLFLMPSDFEPCGISQMIAMRYGTLPVAASVGGLKDTISHGQDGFLFSGATREDAARAFLFAVRDALSLFRSSPESWRTMQQTAMSRRFSWAASAGEYLRIYENARCRLQPPHPALPHEGGSGLL